MKLVQHIRRLALGALVGAPLLLAHVPAAADILWLKSPSADLVGVQADAGTGPLPETVTLGSVAINAFSWWGYQTADSVPGSLDAFELWFNGVLMDGTLSGTAADFFEITRYDFVLNAPVLFAGGAVTLELANTNGDVAWMWQGEIDEFGFRALQIDGEERVTDVPEPQSLALLGLGLVAAFGAGRLRRQSS